MPLYELRKFVVPEFIFGVGARWRLGYYARTMMARRVFIVSDPGVIAAGWTQQVRDALAEVGIASTVFSDVSPNSKDDEVMAGAAMYAAERCDVIVAVGGGSVIDCAKAIAIVHANNCHVRAFEGVDRVEKPGPPLICIPTTAGASADISQFCIVLNSAERYKMAIISKTVIPDVALVDPETTVTMDSYLTACTGIDALTHAIEAFASTASSPIADVHALAAIRLIWANLGQAVREPHLMPARENMALGSLQAGIAFSNASLGAVHALAHSLGGFLDLPHGECNALLLEHVVRFNAPTAPERYRQIGEAMELDLRGASSQILTEQVSQALSTFRNRVGIVGGLAARGVSAAVIPDLAAHAVKDACIVTNPKYANLDDVKAIYGEAL
ncbi:alcohol dehydrogenase-like regulatory protein ErcA [Propionivibrio soli]|uniref:alcohol dehydrogenase-like regulatory protein ErcA n=1 Tax=Propionivibrio soli TaxID=2976531 RepID=UPI0021E80426|nr:alcohol dehydrogenase-like regulatory protein ErcA [Propionivibrio soli]